MRKDDRIGQLSLLASGVELLISYVILLMSTLVGLSLLRVFGTLGSSIQCLILATIALETAMIDTGMIPARNRQEVIQDMKNN